MNLAEKKLRRCFLIQKLEGRQMLHAEGAISGNVFMDADSDGIRDAGEIGVPGVVVDLSTSDASVNRSVISDVNGNFSFEELEPGEYRIAKRQMRATTGTIDTAVVSLTLEDDQTLGGNSFAENAVRPEFIHLGWFFSSAPPESDLVREAIARGEEIAGDVELAALIRSRGQDAPVDVNQPPVGVADSYQASLNTALNIGAVDGVLANDFDNDGDSITATIVATPSHGTVTLNPNGSFTYIPENGFTGVDTFTYRGNDGRFDSGVVSVTITISDPTTSNTVPAVTNDSYQTNENETLSVSAAGGVLTNDVDADGDTLTATVDSQPSNGSVTLNPDGSFSYVPDSDFFGNDSFTYVAGDGIATSAVATVSITVRPVDDGSAFASVTTGSFTDPNLLGTRTDLVAGAPAITANHVDGDVDYSNHSNPPTYGDHHGFDPDGTDANPGITPRPTGIYTTEQPDEDLIHNLEHGHVWISYDPGLLSATDIAALEQLVRDGVGNADGSGQGVILTPRADNDHAIALASWARLLTLDQYDPATIRDFVNINRGKAPEGFITP